MDLTQGKVPSVLLRFALPFLLANVLQALYGGADLFVVGQFDDAASVAGVAIGSQVMQTVTGIITGLTTGTTVLIAIGTGARDKRQVALTIGTATWIFALMAVVLTTVMALGHTPLALLMQTPPEALRDTEHYLLVCSLGIPFIMGYNVVCGILRGLGDSRTPLYFVALACVANIVLDFVLVGGLGLRAMGAAIATVVSQMVSAVLCFRKLMQADGPYRLVPKRIRFELPMLKQIMAQGIPSGVQNSIIAIANVVVQSNINTFGSDAMAGCGSYAKVEGFVFLPITSFAMALTTFTGQNLGAGQYERAKRGARVGFTCSTLLAELIGLTLLLVAPYAIALFNDDPAVIAIGVRQTRTEALFYFALAIAHSISAVMRGAGRAKMPMYTMLVCWCVIRVTYITLALKVWPDITTIFWAYPITWCLSCVVFLLYYLKADWVHSFQKMH